MIELRVLGPDDWPAWRELRLAALTEAPLAFGATLAQWQGDSDRGGQFETSPARCPPQAGNRTDGRGFELASREARWRQRLAVGGSHNVLAAIDGRPVGMAAGLRSDGRFELVSLWVSPTARGRGVGDRLVAEIARWAAGRNAERLYLSVMPDNLAAIALYARNGFADTGEPGDLLPDGVRREIVLAKRL